MLFVKALISVSPNVHIRSMLTLQNGLYSSLPFLCNAGVSVLGGLLSDFIVRKQLLKLTWNRKLLQTLGQPEKSTMVEYVMVLGSIPLTILSRGYSFAISESHLSPVVSLLSNCFSEPGKTDCRINCCIALSFISCKLKCSIFF